MGAEVPADAISGDAPYPVPQYPLPEPTSAHRLAASLERFAVDRLLELRAHNSGDFLPPRSYAGHEVLSDALADMAYTLSLCERPESREALGLTVDKLRALVISLSDRMRPEQVEGFAAYRLAEAVQRLGGVSHFEGQRERLEQLCDTTPLLDAIDRGEVIPPNYEVVTARCEHIRASVFGIKTRRDELLERLRPRFAEAVSRRRGWIDDGIGAWVHYDIYTPDVYLFAEPLRDSIGGWWSLGLAGVLDDLDSLAMPGGAVVWGRSVGALSLAMTIELAGVSARHDLGVSPARWLERAAQALDELGCWFTNGVIDAHRYRMADPYRGSNRRLQMTFDVLGKLLVAAGNLRAGDDRDAVGPCAAWPDVDRLVIFERTGSAAPEDRGPGFAGPDQGGGDPPNAAVSDERVEKGRVIAAAWAYRRRGVGFVLPLMAGANSDYSPSLRAPGLFVQPTGATPCFMPVVIRTTHEHGHSTSTQVLAPSGAPTSIRHRPKELNLTYDGWSLPGHPSTGRSAVDGMRHVSYTASGASLEVLEHLTVCPVAGTSETALSAPETRFVHLIPEVAGGWTPPSGASRGLGGFEGLAISVEHVVGSDGASNNGAGAESLPLNLVTAEVSGMSEWSGFWEVAGRVTQAELPTRDELRYRWIVRPRARVGDTAYGSAYGDALYRPITDRVTRRSMPLPGPSLAGDLARIDVLHLAWPEWWVGTDPTRTERVIELIEESGVRILWTQHNLLPHHQRDVRAQRCYELWAGAAHGVIHHSRWGADVMRARLAYRPDAIHRVIGHGHWGDDLDLYRMLDREDVERSLGWEPGRLRLGVIRENRPGKHLAEVIAAVAASRRHDIELVVRNDSDIAGANPELRDAVAQDPRITVVAGRVSDDLYRRRLRCFDALVLPYESGSMLTTGTAFDAIGMGIPAITRDWAFCDEVFDGANIAYGATADALTALIDELGEETLAAAAAATVERQRATRWADSATATLELVEELRDRDFG